MKTKILHTHFREKRISNNFTESPICPNINKNCVTQPAHAAPNAPYLGMSSKFTPTLTTIPAAYR